MNTQREAAEELVETFQMLGDWEERYRFLIDLGRELPVFPDESRTETNKVHGCQSNVWLIAQTHNENGKIAIDFLADSDAHIVKGLIAILRRIYARRNPEEILDFDIENLMHELELDAHLSTGRRNGLAGMVARIKTLASQSASAGVL